MIREFEIVSVNVGKPMPMIHQEKQIATAIFKHPVEQPLFLSYENFDGDAQADLIKHGGKDKAVCVYSYEHYPYWEKLLNRSLAPGAFGENLTVKGLREDDICIGDVFRIGDVLLQVSQPRQPCHKLAKKHNVTDLAEQIQSSGFTGFYFRVLQEGWVDKGNVLRQIERHPQGVSISFANQIKHRDKNNWEGIRKIIGVKELADNWRNTLSERMKG